jgi:hypothetical protein
VEAEIRALLMSRVDLSHRRQSIPEAEFRDRRLDLSAPPVRSLAARAREIIVECATRHRVLLGVVGVVSVASLGLAVVLTRTGLFLNHGELQIQAIEASLVLFPVALLLFAFGVQWAMRKRRALAILALLPLPAWIACLHLTRQGPQGLENANLLVNDVWILLLGLQLQGVTLFGGNA